MDKTAIATGRIKKRPHPFLFNFLCVVTLGFYVPFYYSRFTKDINTMTKHAFEENEQTEIKFSPLYVFMSLILLYLPFVLGGLISSNILEIPDSDIDTAFFIILAVIYVIPLIIFALYLFFKLKAIKKQVIEIAIRYGRFDVAREFENDANSLTASKRENRIMKAFNMLAEEYNSQN